MSRLLEIGRIVRSHGLRGQVVVELWTNREERFAQGSRLLGPEAELTIRSSSASAPSGGRQRRVVSFENVDTREKADAMRGTVLRAEPIEDESTLWIHELVGADVYTISGDAVGRVECVEANPASDLLVLEDGKLIPLTFVTAVTEGRVAVDLPQGLLDL